VSTTFLQENLKESKVLVDSGVEMTTILKYILDKVHEYGLDSFFICQVDDPALGHYRGDNEPSLSTWRRNPPGMLRKIWESHGGDHKVCSLLMWTTSSPINTNFSEESAACVFKWESLYSTCKRR